MSYEIGRVKKVEEYFDSIELKSAPAGYSNQYLEIKNLNPFIQNQDGYVHTLEYALKEIPVISTGFELLDHAMGGFRPNEFSVLCGATGVGKTTLVANLCLNLAKQKEKFFMVSAEIGYRNFFLRMFSAATGETAFTRNAASIDRFQELDKNHGEIFREPNFFISTYENRVQRSIMLDEIAYLAVEEKIKVVFIDNINFVMDVTKSSEQIIEMDQTIHDMIILCKQLPIHIVMIMHPKKTESGRVVSEFDVKGSASSVQEAHNVFLFNRPDPSLVKEFSDIQEQDRELKLAKLRSFGENTGRKIIFKNCGGKYSEGGIYV